MAADDDVSVTYRAVDELPYNTPAVFVVSPDGRHLDVLMSRAAGIDAIAEAFGLMYPVLQKRLMGLHAVA